LDFQGKYVKAQNQIFLNDVTLQEQGIELFDMLERELFVDVNKARLDQQIKNLYETARSAVDLKNYQAELSRQKLEKEEQEHRLNAYEERRQREKDAQEERRRAQEELRQREKAEQEDRRQAQDELRKREDAAKAAKDEADRNFNKNIGILTGVATFIGAYQCIMPFITSGPGQVTSNRIDIGISVVFTVACFILAAVFFYKAYHPTEDKSQQENDKVN
jgi:cation transport ATPase